MPASFSTESFKNGLSDPKTFRKLLLQNPYEIEEVRSIYPPVINAMLSDDEIGFSTEFHKFWYNKFFIFYCCFCFKCWMRLL